MQHSKEPDVHSSVLVCIDLGGNKGSLLKNNDFSMLTNPYCLKSLYEDPLVAAYISHYGRCQYHLPLGTKGRGAVSCNTECIFKIIEV